MSTEEEKNAKQSKSNNRWIIVVALIGLAIIAIVIGKNALTDKTPEETAPANSATSPASIETEKPAETTTPPAVDEQEPQQNNQESNNTNNQEPTVTTTTKVVKPIVNIKDIAGKSEAEVNKILGKPDKVKEGTFTYQDSGETIKCPVNTYGLVAVKFIDDVAGRITVNPQDIDFNDNVAILGTIGLTAAKESFGNTKWKTWSKKDGLYQIQVFPNKNGKVSLIYIKTDSKYE